MNNSYVHIVYVTIITALLFWATVGPSSSSDAAARRGPVMVASSNNIARATTCTKLNSFLDGICISMVSKSIAKISWSFSDH